MTLKRSGPLKRGTPMKRSPMKRTSTQLSRTRIKAKIVDDPVTTETRRAVHERSGGLCEGRIAPGCTGLAQHVHHRKLRRHNDHTAVNLLDVCNSCHGAIHNPTSIGLPRSWSYDHGFLLRSTDDPTTVLARR